MNHTPGPWIVKHRFYIGREGDPWSLAEVKSCQSVPAANTEEHEANARLIAAAPDLLEACRAAFHALRSYEHGNASPDLAIETATKCREAIEKAGGAL